MPAFHSTRILYDATYQKSAAYLHGMWTSLARSFESELPDESGDEDEKDGMVKMSVGIRIKDKDPNVAVEALKTANLAALTLILFVGRVFNKKNYLDWVLRFKSLYLEDQRKASRGPYPAPR